MPRKGASHLSSSKRGFPESLFRGLAAALVFFALPCALVAQNWSSNLDGTVLDATGAAIPEARVTTRDLATGHTRATITNARGYFSFPLLPVGSYALEVTRQGFAAKTVTGIQLQVSRSERLNITLEVARDRTSVQVEARPPLIETATPVSSEAST